MSTEARIAQQVMILFWVIGMILVAVFCLQPAYAEDHSWHTAFSSYFMASGNWSPADAPEGNEDTAIFGVPGEYTVDFDPHWDSLLVNKQFEVSAGTVTFNLVLEGAWQTFDITYRLEPPTTMFTTAARVGTVAGPQAQLIVGGGHDGYSGTVEAEGALLIGLVPGSSGRVDIGEPGISDPWNNGCADWISAYPTWVGMNGTGSLYVNHGEFSGGSAIIGMSAGAQGTVTVESGGLWNNHGSLTVGQSGTGILNVIGGLHTDDDVYIGRFAGSDGTATGDRCGWTIGGDLYVGGDYDGAGGAGELTLTGYGYSNINVTGEATIWPTGKVTLDPRGTLSVLGQLNAHPGCELDLSGGTLEVSSLTGFDVSLLDWTSGAVNITNDSLSIDVDEPFGQHLPIFSSKSLSVADSLNVGPETNGVLSVTSGGTVTSGSASIGSLSEDMLQAVAVVSGLDSSWTIAGDLNIRGTLDSILSVGHGATVSNGNAYLAAESGTNALVTLLGTSGDVLWDCTGHLYVGGDESDSLGTSTVQVGTGAQLNVAGTMKIWDDSVLEVDGGAVDTHDLDISGEAVLLNSGVLDVSGGMLDIDNGGILNGAITGDSWTEVALHENSTSWSMPGSLEVAASGAGAGRVGALTVETGTTVTVDENVTVNYGDRLVLAGGTINADLIDMLDQDFNGFGTLNGEFATTGSVTATGDLTVGDITSYSGMQIGGTLDVGVHQVIINTNGVFTVGNSTSITGGTLVVPNGIALPTGANLVAYGAISADVATQIGSTIEADGSLSLGDPASPLGFIGEGNLVVNDNVVTIDDANQAALGPMTSLGAAGNPGTLVAANGLTLTATDNVLGFGLIDTPDDPAKSLLNDGSIFGDSAGEQIELTGYLKGLGTLDNVIISGTDDIGSVGPAAVNRGSVDYLGKLIIEIGGLIAGTEHDQINHSATAILGGELAVELIGGFEPDLGDSFTVMTYASHTGQFDTLTLPALAAGLTWNVDYGTSSLTLVVVGDQVMGDMNCDGVLNSLDIDPFVLAMTDSSGYGAAYPDCDVMLADINDDGVVNSLDIDPFVAIMTGG